MKNNKGFALVEALLIFVIIGALAGVGWYVYQRQNSDDSDDSYTYGTNTPAEPEQEESTTPEGYTKYSNQELGLSFVYPTDWGSVSREVLQDTEQEPSSKTMQYVFSNADLTISGHQKDFEPGQRGGGFFDYGGFELDGSTLSLKTHQGAVLSGTGSGYQLNINDNCVYKNEQENLVNGPTFHATCNLNKSNINGINFFIDANNTQISFQQFAELINSVEVE